MKTILALISLFIFLSPAFAQGEANGYKVLSVRADKNGSGYVRFDQPLAGNPASCINGHDSHLAFDLNTEGGKGVMSIALAAQVSGKRMQARGTGACDIYGTVESWNWGYINN